MNLLKFKGLLSTSLLVTFILLMITGFSIPFRFIPVERVYLVRTHLILAITMTILVGIHFYINYKLWKTEITSKP